MNPEEKFALNIRFPIRLSMLMHSVKLNLAYAKEQLKKNGRIQSVRVVLKIAEEDIEDLEYYQKHVKSKEMFP